MQSKIISINPATLEKLGEVNVSSSHDIAEAVKKARNAQSSWATLGVEGRVKELQKLYDYVYAHQKELSEIEIKEMGRPKRDTLDWTFEQFKWNLENAEKILAPETTFETTKELHQVHYEPYGVACVISPWNFPLSNFVTGTLQPLLAGNTIVYKLSEEIPLFGKALNKAWVEACLPDGVFNQVFGAGDVGEQLARSDIDFLHFTGSSITGKKLYKIAAEKFIPVTLELGGSDAGIVFEDANIDAMIEPIFWAKFVNCGQICCGMKRLFVHESRFEELVLKLKAYIEKMKVGDPNDPETVFGPLVAKRQQELLSCQVEDAKSKGAKVIMGGNIPNNLGAYYEPTLLTGITKNMRMYYEELFGPVLPITPFKTEEEAIALANDTPYGLSSYIYTEDRERFKRVASKIEAGAVSHNGVDFSHPANPFGGYKASGLGRTLGKIGLQHCCQVKTISMKK